MLAVSNECRQRAARDLRLEMVAEKTVSRFKEPKYGNTNPRSATSHHALPHALRFFFVLKLSVLITSCQQTQSLRELVEFVASVNVVHRHEAVMQKPMRLNGRL